MSTPSFFFFFSYQMASRIPELASRNPGLPLFKNKYSLEHVDRQASRNPELASKILDCQYSRKKRHSLEHAQRRSESFQNRQLPCSKKKKRAVVAELWWWGDRRSAATGVLFSENAQDSRHSHFFRGRGGARRRQSSTNLYSARAP